MFKNIVNKPTLHRTVPEVIDLASEVPITQVITTNEQVVDHIADITREVKNIETLQSSFTINTSIIPELGFSFTQLSSKIANQDPKYPEMLTKWEDFHLGTSPDNFFAGILEEVKQDLLDSLDYAANSLANFSSVTDIIDIETGKVNKASDLRGKIQSQKELENIEECLLNKILQNIITTADLKSFDQVLRSLIALLKYSNLAVHLDYHKTSANLRNRINTIVKNALIRKELEVLGSIFYKIEKPLTSFLRQQTYSNNCEDFSLLTNLVTVESAKLQNKFLEKLYFYQKYHESSYQDRLNLISIHQQKAKNVQIIKTLEYLLEAIDNVVRTGDLQSSLKSYVMNKTYSK